jgi:hypothetical protein
LIHNEGKAKLQIQPAILFILIKNLIVGGAIYYSSGPHLLLWWVAGSAVFYALVALNLLISAEQRLDERAAELDRRLAELENAYTRDADQGFLAIGRRP